MVEAVFSMKCGQELDHCLWTAITGDREAAATGSRRYFLSH